MKRKSTTISSSSSSSKDKKLKYFASATQLKEKKASNSNLLKPQIADNRFSKYTIKPIYRQINLQQ